MKKKHLFKYNTEQILTIHNEERMLKRKSKEAKARGRPLRGGLAH